MLTGPPGDEAEPDGLTFAQGGLDINVHAINALGVHPLDYLQFDDLVPLCEAARRWSLCCAIAPWRLPRGTGSPVNPIAVISPMPGAKGALPASSSL